MQFKSKTLTNYYSSNPDDYTLRFHHYNIVVDDESKAEYELLEDDIKKLREYNQDDSIIYFSDILNLQKLVNNTTIIDNQNDVYLRIRNNEEYQEFKKLNLNISIIVSIKDIRNIDVNDSKIVLQVDTINELQLDDLIELRKKYNIESILVGQIRYISNDYKYLLDVLSKQFGIDASNQLELEKNNEVTNDIYKVDLYVDIINNINDIIMKNKTDSIVDTIKNIFFYLAENIIYDDNGLERTNVESQNLYGALFNHKAVCEGYSKLFRQILSLLEIDSLVVSGGGSKENGGHVWTQVKINDEWYNADVTAQSYEIHNGDGKNLFLVSDEHCRYKSSSPFAKKCLYNYYDKVKYK